MKYPLFLLLSILCIQLTAQTGRITGKVLGKGSNISVPFAMVNIMLNDSILKTDTTSIEGDFQLDSLSTGEYAIEASYIGFATEHKKILVKKNETVFVEFKIGKGVREAEVLIVGHANKCFPNVNLNSSFLNKIQSITGVVTDASNDQLVPFANVQLLLNDSIVRITVTNFDGNFKLDSITVGKYDVVVSYVGFSRKKVSGVVVENGKDVDLAIGISQGIRIVCGGLIMYKKPLFEKDNTTIETNFSREDINRMSY